MGLVYIVETTESHVDNLFYVCVLLILRGSRCLYSE